MRILLPLLLFIGLLILAVYLFPERKPAEPAAIDPKVSAEEQPPANDTSGRPPGIDTSYAAGVCALVPKETLREIFDIPAGIEIELTHSGNQAECAIEWYIPEERRGGGKIIRLTDRRSPVSQRAWDRREEAARTGELTKVPGVGEAAYYSPMYGSLTVAQPGYLIEILLRPDFGVLPEDMDADGHIRQLRAVYESVDW